MEPGSSLSLLSASSPDFERLKLELERRLKLGERAMCALESLTPSGSEFVNDPEACVAWVKKVRQGQLAVIRKFSQRLDSSRALTKGLRSALSDLVRACIEPDSIGKRLLMLRGPAEVYVLAACTAIKKCEKPQPQLSGSLA